MSGRSALERRIQRLEHALRSQGRWFIIHCLEGEEDSVRIDELCGKIEREHGPLSSATDQILIIPGFIQGATYQEGFTIQTTSN